MMIDMICNDIYIWSIFIFVFNIESHSMDAIGELPIIVIIMMMCDI